MRLGEHCFLFVLTTPNLVLWDQPTKMEVPTNDDMRCTNAGSGNAPSIEASAAASADPRGSKLPPRTRARQGASPSSSLVPFLFWGEGSPAKIDFRKKIGYYSNLSTGGPSQNGWLGFWAQLPVARWTPPLFNQFFSWRRVPIPLNSNKPKWTPILFFP